MSIEKAASSFLALGGVSNCNETNELSARPQERRRRNIPGLSSGVTVRPNSQIYGLTAEDRNRLGGIEYRGLKLLLKIVFCCSLTYTPCGAEHGLTQDRLFLRDPPIRRYLSCPVDPQGSGQGHGLSPRNRTGQNLVVRSPRVLYR